jgi:hypothetical protein
MGAAMTASSSNRRDDAQADAVLGAPNNVTSGALEAPDTRPVGRSQQARRSIPLASAWRVS